MKTSYKKWDNKVLVQDQLDPDPGHGCHSTICPKWIEGKYQYILEEAAKMTSPNKNVLGILSMMAKLDGSCLLFILNSKN